jgi:hypothetical protein
VPEVAAALAAVDLLANHAEAPIDRFSKGAFERRKKARPPCSALELAIVDEQRLAASRALEGAGPLFVQ